MMVDPDGTLDALSSLGLTSPLTDQKISPAAQQEAAPSSAVAGSRCEDVPTEAHIQTDTQVSEQDAGSRQSPAMNNT